MKLRSLALVTSVIASFPAFGARPGSPAITAGNPLRISANALAFRYLSYDGERITHCTHSVESAEGGDWNVSCEDSARRFKRNYRVHFWVSAYTHSTEPRISYETLYWIVDDSNPKSPKGHSSTVWFHLKDPSALSLLEFRQGVDEDTAYLELTLDLQRSVR